MMVTRRCAQHRPEHKEMLERMEGRVDAPADRAAVADTVEPVVRRDGYQFCEKHQQEYRQYCSGCAVGSPAANKQITNKETTDDHMQGNAKAEDPQ